MNNAEKLRTIIDRYRAVYASAFYFSKNLSFFERRRIYRKLFKTFWKEFRLFRSVVEITPKSTDTFPNESNIEI